MDWSWAESGGGNGNNIAVRIEKSSDDKFFITGRFYQTIDLDTLSLTSAGGQDLFIAQFDSEGNRLNAAHARGTNNITVTDFHIDSFGGIYDVAYETAIDDSLNVYVTGRYKKHH